MGALSLLAVRRRRRPCGGGVYQRLSGRACRGGGSGGAGARWVGGAALPRCVRIHFVGMPSPVRERKANLAVFVSMSWQGMELNLG